MTGVQPHRTPILTAALIAWNAGLCPLRPKENGTKAPDAASWKRYQQQRPTRQEVINRFRNAKGLGIVTGAISGNLELLEFDDRPTYVAYRELAAATGLGDLIERIEAGYLEESPSSGIHWPYRCPEIAGNTKLARKADANGEIKVLIETRGEGGYFITAPSYGPVHPTGKPYVLLQGAFDEISTITPGERDDLFALARSFDQMPRQERQPPPATASSTPGGRPGDQYNARATWDGILGARGWTPVFTRAGLTHWRRPGKDRGTSATTNYSGSDLLYVFTSSTIFEPERAYSKFGALTLLDYDGDFGAAARALAALGYGADSHMRQNRRKKVFFRVQG